MIRVLKQHGDKAVLLAAGLLVAASLGWWQRQRSRLEALHRQPVAAALGDSVHEPASWPQPVRPAAKWERPPAQSHGAGWIYEVFTPPVIYYNAPARAFTVSPPSHPAEGARFELQLLAVRREPFRLQLRGYVGGPGDYVAAFTSPQSPETLLAREGRHFAGLGLALRRFEVKKVIVTHRDDWPVYEVAALAVLHDEQTEQEVVLDSRAPRLTDTPLAVLRFAPGAGPARELREGDVWPEASATYHVERIQLDPPEVVIAKHVAGVPFPERHVLQPEAADKGVAATASDAPPRRLAKLPPGKDALAGEAR